MSINGIGGSPAGNNFTPLELEGDFTSVAGKLAVLMLENEETQKEIDRDSLANAREAYSEALENEVQALREQADAQRTGAIVTGALNMAAAGLEVYASVATYEADLAAAAAKQTNSEYCKPLLWQAPAAKVFSGLAGPLGSVVSHNYGAADAKAAQGAGEQASWEIDDARKAIDDSDAAQDKALDWVSGLIGQDAAVTTAILSNKA